MLSTMRFFNSAQSAAFMLANRGVDSWSPKYQPRVTTSKIENKTNVNTLTDHLDHIFVLFKGHIKQNKYISLNNDWN